MTTDATRNQAFRISLRELLSLFAALAVGCASLKYANAWWQGVVIALGFIAVASAGALALVDRGKWQAFAVGFLVWALGYGVLVQSCRTIAPSGDGSRTRNYEIDRPTEGRLPTTRLMSPLYDSVVRTMWKNVTTGEEVEESGLPPNAKKVMSAGVNIAISREPQYVPANLQSGFAPIPAALLGSSYTSLGPRPDQQQFMLIGHFLWALLLGYVGGKFAQFVYLRRLRASS